MRCPCEGPKRDKRCQTGTPPVLEVHSKECPVLFHTVVIPASVGDPTTMPPEPGMYRNVRLTYEATGDAYLFDSDGIPQLLANIGPVAQVTSVNGQTGDVVLDAADVNAQAPLTAGANIAIDSDNVISATDTTYTAGANITIDANNEISATNTTYTAGTNISIDADNVISATDTTYTAGANVSIDANHVISATDTTYSNFVGTDGVDAGAAGLVPAPATTDAGKFLKADGTWDTAAMPLYTTYGQNQDGAMTQKATTDLVYTAGNPKKINIGDNGVTGGTNSIIIGSEDSGTISSSATDIIAIGHNITDNNNESIAIGHGASTGTSSGNGNAIAIGHNATASNVYAIAIGSNNGNPGDSSATRATDISAIAIGRDAYASGQESLCIGRGEAGYAGLVLNTSNTYTAAYADGNYQGFAFAVGPVSYAKNRAMAIGHKAKAVGSTGTTDAVAIGFSADSEYSSSIALGAYAKPRAQGVVDVSTGTNSHGYQGTNDQSRTDYRVISGVHDPDQAQDAATKNYVDTQVGNIETILQTLNSGTGV